MYNNGYIVKDSVDNEDLLIEQGVYRGLESYHSWPLSQKNDDTSKELTVAAEALFERNDYYEIITEVELLRRYVDHCRKLKIDIIIMKIMSNKDKFIADEDLNEIEILGYDCMAGDSVSYLIELHGGYNCESYNNLKNAVNSNGLLNTYDEVVDFIEKRNILLKQGVNLENYWEPVPVMLSIVEC